MSIEHNVARLACGYKRGNAVLINQKYALTVKHCLEPYVKNNEKVILFCNNGREYVEIEAEPVEYSEYEDGYALLAVECEWPVGEISLVTCSIHPFDEFAAVGFNRNHNIKPSWRKLVFNSSSGIILQDMICDLAFLDYTKEKSVEGLSGSPIVLNDRSNNVIGLITQQSLENGEAFEIGGISVKSQQDVLDKYCIQIKEYDLNTYLDTKVCIPQNNQQISIILQSMEKSFMTDYSLLDNIPLCYEPVIDRSYEINKTYETLKMFNYIYVGGMHGIGKTAFAQKYIATYKERYDCIVFVNNDNNVKELIMDDNAITIRNLSRRTVNDRRESDDDYYKRKLRVLREIVNDKVLFVIDSISLSDSYLTDVINIGAKFILLTNDSVTSIPAPHISIESFFNSDDLITLFKYYYKRDDIDFQSSYLWDLFRMCQNHTLTIKLLALQMRANHKTPEEMYYLLEKYGLGRGMSDNIYYFDNGYERYLSAFDFIRPLFRIDKLEERLGNFLEFLALFRMEEIRVVDLITWLSNEDIRNIIEYLYHRGWVIYNEETDKVCIHSIIREVIIYERTVVMDKHANAINRILNEYTDFSLNITDLSTRMYYGKIIKVLISNTFSFEKLFTFALKAERALSFAYLINESIELANKILDWLRQYRSEDCFNIGRMNYCLGWTYATQLRERERGISLMEEGLRDMLRYEYPMNKEQIRQLSEVYGDCALVRSRMKNGDKSKAIEEGITAVTYFKKLCDNTVEYYSRLSWLEVFVAECYINSRNLDEANFWIDQAEHHVIEGPGENSVFYMHILYRKAKLYKAKGDYHNALRHVLVFQNQYLKYYPFVSKANLEHVLFIGSLLEQVGNVEEASKYYESAKKITQKLYDEN